MRNKSGRMIALAVAGAMTAQVPMVAGSVASDGVFDPNQPCAAFLPAEDNLDKAVIGQWVSGYIAGSSGEVLPTNEAGNERLIQRLNAACAATPEASLLAVIGVLVAKDKSLAADPIMLVPGSAEEGRALLERFLRPDTDLAALTASLKPTPEDLRAVYAEPLATALVEAYEQAFAPGATIEPGEGQNEILSSFTTTFDLKNGVGPLDRFPGGYKDILDLFVSDVPIAAFKFVRAGETTGRAIDGLIYVNGRWVIMPKPWRGLE